MESAKTTGREAEGTERRDARESAPAEEPAADVRVPEWLARQLFKIFV